MVKQLLASNYHFELDCSMKNILIVRRYTESRDKGRRFIFLMSIMYLKVIDHRIFHCICRIIIPNIEFKGSIIS